MNYLEAWNGLKSALQEAHSIIDLKSIRDRAEAYRYALMIAGESKATIKKMEELKLRAERRAGELLQTMEKQRPGTYQQRYKDDTLALPKTYKELGLTKIDAAKWQKIAMIPEKDFEHWIKTNDELSIMSPRNRTALEG
jgi:hypothetical protein